jgi:pimeloyl-ACP methyl ester carboxylesterase
MEAPPRLSPLGLLRQGRGLLELPRLLWEFPDLARQPRGRGEPVIVLPGYGAGDASTLVLQAFLRFLGYRVRGWALGRNTGAVPVLLPRVVRRVAGIAREAKQRVRLVGWSLGGYLAREAARDRPDIVEQVITLGTPAVGGPKYTAVAGVYRRRGVDLDAIEAAVDARNRKPLEVPVTAIYSRSDGVVAWEACIDRVSPNVNHVEVRTTHLGLGFAPEVYRIIAESLACASEGEGRPST